MGEKGSERISWRLVKNNRAPTNDLQPYQTLTDTVDICVKGDKSHNLYRRLRPEGEMVNYFSANY